MNGARNIKALAEEQRTGKVERAMPLNMTLDAVLFVLRFADMMGLSNTRNGCGRLFANPADIRSDALIFP